MASRTEVQQALIAAHRSGDVATARRMAQALQMMDEWDAVPVAAPLGQVATPPKPTFSFRERANEFSAGVGKAWGQAVTDLTQQADKFGERYMQAVNDPTIGRIPFGPLARAGYGVVEDIAASIEPFVRNPAMVADIAQGMARQASTGPQGAGEVFGSLVSPGQVGKAFNQPVIGRMANDVGEYGMAHRPPSAESGAPLYDLTGGGSVYPDDIYSPQADRFYGHFGGGDPMDKATIRIIKSYRNEPTAPVKIYRAVPKGAGAGDINSGDWVTVNKDYAKFHGESQFGDDYEILEKTVKAGEIFTNADSIHEFGYWPQTQK